MIPTAEQLEIWDRITALTNKPNLSDDDIAQIRELATELPAVMADQLEEGLFLIEADKTRRKA